MHKTPAEKPPATEESPAHTLKKFLQYTLKKREKERTATTLALPTQRSTGYHTPHDESPPLPDTLTRLTDSCRHVPSLKLLEDAQHTAVLPSLQTPCC
jgi:hypothetical protein